MLFFAGWTMLSIAWALDPSVALRRLAIFAILCLASAATAGRCSLRQILLLTFFCTTFFLLIGVSAEIALGTFRPFSHDYRFGGTQHWTYQGINCALVVLSGVAAADVVKRRRRLFQVCALSGLIFLLLTGSRAEFAEAVLCLAVYWFSFRSRRHKVAAGIALAVMSCALLLTFGNARLQDFKNAANLAREDPAVDSFKGRAAIWEQAGYYISEHPILGCGYGSFWTEARVKEISTTLRWGVGSAHSAYVDCFVSLGLVGLGLYISVLLGGVARSFALYGASRRPALAFSGTLLILCLVGGIFESAMLEGTFLTFLSMTALVRLGFVCGPVLIGRVSQ
jgi:O-antigen ligase